MAATMTAVYEPATGSVLLTLTATNGTLALLQRTDANGSNVPVRTASGTFPRPVGTTVLRDYEASAGLVSYRVNGTAGSAGASVTVTIPLPRVASVVMPSLLVEPDLVTGYTAGRESSTTVHWVVDRPDPAVTLSPLRLRRGVLEYWCRSYSSTQSLVALYDLGQAVFLRQAHPGLDLYHVASGDVQVTADPATGTFTLSVPFVEVARGNSPIIGAFGWTWAALAATGATWETVSATYPTWAALTTGPPQ